MITDKLEAACDMQSSSKADPKTDGTRICLMIKHYKEGAMTSRLKQLKIGAKVELSNYSGKFELERLTKIKDVYLICAGTGLTPMIRLLTNAIEMENISYASLINSKLSNSHNY